MAATHCGAPPRRGRSPRVAPDRRRGTTQPSLSELISEYLQAPVPWNPFLPGIHRNQQENPEIGSYRGRLRDFCARAPARSEGFHALADANQARYKAMM